MLQIWGCLCVLNCKIVTNHLAQLFTIMLLTEDASPYEFNLLAGFKQPNKPQIPFPYFSTFARPRIISCS